jgi:hypothetical protein
MRCRLAIVHSTGLNDSRVSSAAQLMTEQGLPSLSHIFCPDQNYQTIFKRLVLIISDIVTCPSSRLILRHVNRIRYYYYYYLYIYISMCQYDTFHSITINL